MKMTAMAEKTLSNEEGISICSLGDFLKFLSKHDDDAILFRGQRQDWPLLPAIGRHEFVARNDKTPEEFEATTLRLVKKQSIPFLQYKPESDWEWLALAQHHCLPTRLLDWTINPLIGLWFAVCKSEKEKSGNGVVWMFKPSEEAIASEGYVLKTPPNKITKTMVFTPTHITPRIRAQAGCFTIHLYQKRQLSFLPLERQAKYKRVLSKLVIPSNSFASIRFDLDRVGVNEASIFPDMDGLCRHLAWLHTIAEDE